MTAPAPRRALALAALLLATALPAPAPAQIPGISPAPQLWKWWRANAGQLLAFYATRRFGDDRELERENIRELVDDLLANGGRIREEVLTEMGHDPGPISLQVSGMVPNDYRQRRFTFSRGGAALWLAPDAYGYELAPMGQRRWLHRELREQIVQAVLWTQITGNRPDNLIRRFFSRRLLPAWVFLGAGAHLGGDRLGIEDQLLFAGIEEGKPLPPSQFQFLPTLTAWNREAGYQQARDFCAWLIREYGIDAFMKLLPAFQRRPTQHAQVFQSAFGVHLHQARAAWLEDLRARAARHRAAAPRPAEARRLLVVPGWLGPFSPAPDGAHIALGVNRRDPRSRLLDLSLAARFGDRKPVDFVGGDPILGPPVWLPSGDVLTLEQTHTDFGRRLQRITLHEVDRRRKRDGVLQDFRKAVTLGPRVFERVVKGHPSFLYRGRNLRELGISPSGRWLSALAFPTARPELLVFELPKTEELEPDTPLTPTYRLALPEGTTGHRWLANRDEVLVVSEDATGSTLTRVLPEEQHLEEVLRREGRLRSAFGTRARIFFVEEVEPAVDRLVEFNPDTGTMREVFRSGEGILSPVPVEGGRYVLYGAVTKDGFTLEEYPLPDPLVGAELGDSPAPGASAVAPTPSTAPTHPGMAPIPVPDAGPGVAPVLEGGAGLAGEPAGPAPSAEEVMRAALVGIDLGGSGGAPAALEEPGASGEDGGETAVASALAAEVFPSGGTEAGRGVGFAHVPYHPRYNKMDQDFLFDEDALGTTLEWRDPFNTRSIQVAAWRGDGVQKANFEAVYYSNRKSPSWFFGIFDSDDEDVLDLFPFSNFTSAHSQRGAIGGINYQLTPQQSLAVTAETRSLEFDPVVFRGRIPGFDPRLNTLRIHWTLNELTSALDNSGLNSVGDRWMKLTLGRTGLGSDVDYWEILGDLRTYFPLDRASDSIAVRLAFGLRDIDQTPTPIPLDFSLGGPESFRGIRPAALVGENFIQSTIEYRRLLSRNSGLRKLLSKFSLGNLFRAFDSDRVYTSLFFDMGTAYSDHFQWGHVERSVGIELRAQGLVTTLRPVTFRLGFAHGFGPFGSNDIYLVRSSSF